MNRLEHLATQVLGCVNHQWSWSCGTL